jgi:hypothetical protein
MHAPAKIYIEDFHELVATVWEVVAANGGEESGHVNIGADDGIEHPFYAEICHAFKAVFEGVHAADYDCPRGSEAFAGEETEERAFAGAISCGRNELFR